MKKKKKKKKKKIVNMFLVNELCWFSFYLIILLEIQFDTFDVATSPIYVVTIEGTAPFIKINQFWRIAYLKLMF